MQYKVKIGTGTIIGNLLRQIALTQLDAVNAIAYSVGQLSTVIATNNNSVLEDMIEFGNNLSSYVYALDDGVDYKRVTIDVENILTINDLAEAGVTVYNPNNLNGELLHLLNGATTVTVFFRKYNNLSLADENRNFLESKGVDLTNVTVINSRFRGIKNVTFEVSPCDLNHEYLDIHLDGVIGEAASGLMNTVLEKLDAVLLPLRSEN